MALPTNLAAKIKSLPMDPTVLATNLELAYLLSFAAHRNHAINQLSLMTQFISIPEILINLLSNIINSPISKMKPINNCSNKPAKTTNSKANKLQKALDAASKSSMPEWLPRLTTWRSSICQEKDPKMKRNCSLLKKMSSSTGLRNLKAITLLSGLKQQRIS